MWFARLSLCALVYTWLPMSYARENDPNAIKEDIEAVIRTTLIRVQQHPVKTVPLTSSVQRLNFIPAATANNLQAMDEGLMIYQLVFEILAGEDEEQILHEILHLRDLVEHLAHLNSCSFENPVNQEMQQTLKEEYDASHYTVEKLAFDRFESFLLSILDQLGDSTSC